MEFYRQDIVGNIFRIYSPRHSDPSELRVKSSWHSLQETRPLLAQHSSQLANPPTAVSAQAEENSERNVIGVANYLLQLNQQ